MILFLLGVALAGDGLWAAVHPLGETGPARVEAGDAVRDLALGMTEGLHIGPGSRHLLSEFRRAILELDPRSLYGVLPVAEEGARSMPILAGLDQQMWSLVLVPDVPVAQTTTLGCVDGRLTMRPTTLSLDGAGRTWHVDGDVAAELGPVGHHRAAAIWEAWLSTTAAELSGSRPIRAEASRLQPALDGDDARLWTAVFDAAPALATRVSQALVVDSIASREGADLSWDVRTRVDAAKLADAGYPKLARYLRRLGRTVQMSLTLRDAHAKQLGRMDIDSADLSTRIRGRTRGPALLPDGGGDGVRPTDASAALVVVLDAELHSDGVLVRLRDYAMPLSWEYGAERAALVAVIKDLPTLEITGTSGFTSWLTQLADGLLDLHGNADLVFRAVAHGPAGQGTVSRIDYARDGAVEAEVDAVLMDNGLLRFFLHLVGRKFVPGDNEVAEGVSLSATLVRAFERDWMAMRATWLAAQVDVPQAPMLDDVATE